MERQHTGGTRLRCDGAAPLEHRRRITSAPARSLQSARPMASRRSAGEHAIEMRGIAKARGKDNIDEGKCRRRRSVNIAKALKPAFYKVLGERLSRVLERLLEVSPRQAERSGDAAEIELGIAEAPGGLRQDRPHQSSLHSTLRNEFLRLQRSARAFTTAA